jgi:glucose-6-phosphate 1-epimerase
MDNLAHIAGLNKRFGIPETAQVVAGNGGLPKVQIATGAAAGEIYLYGAHVTSWRPAGTEEVIFLSERSHWEAGQPIRGGIPICFPWFRNKAEEPGAPKHGFVRIKEWRLDSIAAQDDGSVTVVCVTESDANTRHLWPHDFCAAYRVTFGKTLRLELTVINIGPVTVRFEEALHTYFHVGHVQQVRVRGLDQARYLDNVDGNREKVQAGDIAIAGQTDNAYLATQASPEVHDNSLRRILRTDKENSETTVVWNPWIEGATPLTDLGPDEWQHMICVEASNVLRCPVALEAGEEHTLKATLRVLPQQS